MGASFRSIERVDVRAEAPDGSERVCFLGRPRPRLGGGRAAGVRRYAPQFTETPKMVGETTGHGWRPSEESLRFSGCPYAEFVMETAKVVGAPNQVHARLKRLEPMSRMTAFAR